MRKRIACINEAPIHEHERRIALEDSRVRHNSWLESQGTSGSEGQSSEFPLGGGSSTCY